MAPQSFLNIAKILQTIRLIGAYLLVEHHKFLI